jgi:hypothetical protein
VFNQLAAAQRPCRVERLHHPERQTSKAVRGLQNRADPRRKLPLAAPPPLAKQPKTGLSWHAFNVGMQCEIDKRR